MKHLSHAERVRTLVAHTPVGVLSTNSTRSVGFPFGSRVIFALQGSTPLLLISTLASHTRNLVADDRCSLLVAEAGDRPLTRGRVTLVCRSSRVGADAIEGARGVFLAAHPDASVYVDFRDFSLWRLEVSEARYVGGFGRMSWISGQQWASAEPDPVAASAAGIISHMNDDHVDAMVLYCQEQAGLPSTLSATMSAVDRYGFDLEATTAEGTQSVRLSFSGKVRGAGDVRRELVSMVAQARSVRAEREGTSSV